MRSEAGDKIRLTSLLIAYLNHSLPQTAIDFLGSVTNKLWVNEHTKN